MRKKYKFLSHFKEKAILLFANVKIFIIVKSRLLKIFTFSNIFVFFVLHKRDQF